MKSVSRRYAVLFLFFLLCLLAAPFFLETVFPSLSRLLWLFLRIFILSIDQWILWGILIFGITVFFAYRIIGKGTPSPEPQEPRLENSSMASLKSWRLSFSAHPGDRWMMKNLKRELIHILIATYASRKRISPDYQVFDAFKNRQIPLPEQVYRFLFTEKPRSFRSVLHGYLRRISGRERREFQRNLEASLTFLENFMEIKRDEETDEQYSD